MRPHIRTKLNKIHITTLHYALPGKENLFKYLIKLRIFDLY